MRQTFTLAYERQAVNLASESALVLARHKTRTLILCVDAVCERPEGSRYTPGDG
jgi:hypothetical protein